MARHLLARSREALEDARTLLAARRLRGGALRAVDATIDAARALLAPLGLDTTDPAGAAALFDRRLVATDLVSRGCGLALHQALRALAEARLGDVPVLYDARAAALRDGAALLLAEAEIVIERLIAERALPAPESARPDEDEGEI
jgi:uncharacterized protein (UPF0332 family)